MPDVSYYPKITESKNGSVVPLANILNGIKTGHWKDVVTGYRVLRDTFGKTSDQAKHATNEFPYFTASGTFSIRSEGGLIEHSGFAAIDFDAIDDVIGAKDVLKSDPYTYSVFLSRSAHGLCALVKIPPENHKLSFKSLEKYYQDCYGLEIDYLADVSRPRFVSFDPEIYINEDSDIYTDIEKPKPAQPVNYSPPPVSNEKKPMNEIFFMACEWVESKGLHFQEGSRHKYVYQLACICNRLNISQSECENFVFASFPHFRQHPSNAISDAYKRHSSERGKDEKYTFKGSTTQYNSPKEKPLESEEVEYFLSGRIADFASPVDKPDPIISVCVNGDEHVIATAGNLTAIYGPSKSGKSGVLQGIQAGAMVSHNLIDTVGFTIKHNVDGKALIHVDTEQARYNWDKNYRSTVSRSELGYAPTWFKSIWLKGLEVKKMYSLIEEACKRFSDEFGGIYMIVIDGIADLVSDPNDYPACKEMVDEKLAVLAEKYNCPLLTILHLNPGSEKGRGHLGSHLNRRCETIIRIQKQEDDTNVIKFPLARNAGQVPEICFGFNKSAGHHRFMYFVDKGQVSKSSEADTLKDLRSKVLPLGTAMEARLVIKAIQARIGSSKTKAESVFYRMIDLGIINYEIETGQISEVSMIIPNAA